MFGRIVIFASIFIGSLTLDAISENTEKVVWSGDVNADGSPTKAITIVRNKYYQIKASGFVNLGKWIQQGDKLASDACYQFNQKGTIIDLESSLKNSSNISVCDGKYHPDHIYISKAFRAEQDRIHFWVNDISYDDNEGNFQVQIIEVEPVESNKNNELTFRRRP